MKPKNIYITTVILAIILVGFLYFIIKNNNKEAELPKTNFDAESQLPNTNINFKYPSEGFYNLGINLTKIEPAADIISGIHTEPTAEFDNNAQSAYVISEIKLLKNEKNFEDIEKFVSSYKEDFGLSTFDREYAKENGQIIDISGNKYFVYKVTEDATVWRALTITAEGIIEVSLAYTNSFTPHSENIYKNNDGLFLEILENINLK
ncbi:MAG: hypothetical protein WC348_03720 [Patescibacteria group bacterium]|jgi:hypothetical protein